MRKLAAVVLIRLFENKSEEIEQILLAAFIKAKQNKQKK
jgi:hypothetical protein